MNKTIYRLMSVILMLAFTLGSYASAGAASEFGVSAQQTTGTRMLIPLYSYPPAQWASVINANTYKNIDVIINPSNGPGTSQESNYVNGVAQLRSAGVGIFGYIYTGYGTRPLATVRAEVDTWKNWYGVDGIFFDEAANDAINISYYSDLQTYVSSKAMTSILNPGTGTMEAYMTVANTNVIYENDPSSTLSVPSWASNYPASKFGALQYAASAAQMRTFVANAKAKNIGYVFVTDDVLNNPWDQLPAYLAEEAALLAGNTTVSTPTQTAIASATPTGVVTKIATSTLASTVVAAASTPIGEVSAVNPCIGAPAPATWKVVVFVLENRTRSQVIGNTAAPYISSLASKCGSSVVWNDADKKVNGTNDNSGGYLSKPNYAVMTNGQSPSATGIIDDTYATKTTALSIYDQMLSKGMSFKDYYGSTTAGGCSVSWSGDYHDPIRYYSSISSAVCNAHDVPISQFMTDVNSGNLPSFSMILPNSSDSMHDNTTTSGDTYTKNFLEPFLNSAEYASRHVALFLLFDEDTPVPNVLIAPSIVSGSLYQPIAGNNPVSHFSALRTWEEMLGLPLLGDTQQAPSLLAYYGGAKVLATNTPINTPTKTATPVAATVTATAQATNTIVPVASATSTLINTPTKTSTPIAPSATSTVQATNTIAPVASATSTLINTPTKTSTPIAPSATSTVQATNTIAPTMKPTNTILPSATSTLTATTQPSFTPSATTTLTQVPTASPTTLPTKTATIIAPTATLIPTVISTIVSTGQNVVDVRVKRGKDDVEESSTGKMDINSSDLELVYDKNNQVVGIRFSTVNIPKGATITNAYIQFTVDKTSSIATVLSIQGEASPNAASFTTKRYNVSSRLRTSKSVNWSPVAWLQLKAKGPDQRTPNLAAIVQEIVNQSGWTEGNSLVMIITGTGKRMAEAYEGHRAGATLLHIEYSLPVISANVPILTPTLLPTGSPIPSPTNSVTSAAPTATIVPTETATTVPTAVPSTPTISVTDTPSPTEVVPTQTETPTETPLAPAP